MRISTPTLFRKAATQALALVVALSFLGGSSRADEPITLPPGVDFSVLPAPPADDSPAGLADLDVVLYVQASRTPEQVAFAKKMDGISVFEMGREIFGPWFTRENLPKTAAILRQVGRVTDKVKEDAKKKWERPRPYTRSALIAPVVGKPGDAGSYPSGHAYGTATADFVLAAAFPEHAAQFDEMTHRVMWGRILGGVHYPSDTEAGRLLAKDVIEKMLPTPAMQEALTTIRAEAAPFLAAEAANQTKAADIAKVPAKP